jgi:hypothetical protein
VYQRKKGTKSKEAQRNEWVKPVTSSCQVASARARRRRERLCWRERWASSCARIARISSSGIAYSRGRPNVR